MAHAEETASGEYELAWEDESEAELSQTTTPTDSDWEKYGLPYSQEEDCQEKGVHVLPGDASPQEPCCLTGHS